MRCGRMHEKQAGDPSDSDVTREDGLRPAGPRVAITYCTQCNWLLRSAWMAQELLSTFGTDIGEAAVRGTRAPAGAAG